MTPSRVGFDFNLWGMRITRGGFPVAPGETVDKLLSVSERLAAGQPIGSGLVEGGCKQIIGRRLKQTGARWCPRRADRMASLCCNLYSNLWDPYWNSRCA